MQAHTALAALSSMIGDDSYASTFQSLGQYRTALLNHLEDMAVAHAGATLATSVALTVCTPRSDCHACGGANKQCSMNCSQASGSTRSRFDNLRSCDECWKTCGSCASAAANAAIILARSDAARFEWALPILDGSSEQLAESRAMALGIALLGGFSGRDAVDLAMKTSRTKEQQ